MLTKPRVKNYKSLVLVTTLMNTKQVGALSDVTRDTVQAVQEMMSHTMELVDRYTGGEAQSLDELRDQLKTTRESFEARIKALEEKARG